MKQKIMADVRWLPIRLLTFGCFVVTLIFYVAITFAASSADKDVDDTGIFFRIKKRGMYCENPRKNISKKTCGQIDIGEIVEYLNEDFNIFIKVKNKSGQIGWIGRSTVEEGDGLKATTKSTHNSHQQARSGITRTATKQIDNKIHTELNTKGDVGSQTNTYISLFLLVFPLLFGIVVVLAQPRIIVEWTDRLGNWAINRREGTQNKVGKHYKYIIRPFLWGLVKIDKWTANIKEEHLRSAVRSNAYIYFVSIFTIMVIYAAIIIAAIVIMIIILWIALWIWSMSNSGDSGESRSGYSVKKTRLFGKDYTENYNASGNKTGSSEVKEHIFGGQYVEHYDATGNKTGQSEQKERVFGDKYTQHYDESGDKAGISEEKERLLGDKYIQNYDQDGNKTGHSERKETLFGDKYIEHYDQTGKRTGKSEDK